ncbi:iron-containing redox enzyme family protein [Massilia sp. R798]|uniref:Iron-containing redox enzyme family protein n=2 Tax=Massilia soli TaxID=2792854 RepID=A0ABS7SN94_9BURK|nr:iron-containing redox enzyme family protein [Massilia soli]
MPVREPMLAAPCPPAAQPAAASAKSIYLAMSQGLERQPEAAHHFLRRCLADAEALPVALPLDPSRLDNWSQRHVLDVGAAYQDYLARRKAGAPRQYFASKAAALYFLRAVAPTKLVDGAWLYGVLPHWQDVAFHGLIRTYLEELGDGVADKNHVAIYQQLLATHGCDQWHDLSDEHFEQGAIQLALAAQADQFLPELIGYNLGYEQLPLHLLITSYELNELGIDPYYFTLHVTVDNGSNGHAHKAIAALQALMARADDPAAFYQRVLNGYRLNELGACTTSVIGAFDIDKELKRLLADKAIIGKDMHSDYCRIEGKAVSAWLENPAAIGDFLDAMTRAGWIQRGQDAAASRFWGLVSGPRAEMFGVFSPYELQVLRDWIEQAPGGASAARREPSYRARQRNLRELAGSAEARPAAMRGVIRHWGQAANDGGAAGQNALRVFEQQVAECGGKDAAMALLGAAIAPSTHHTPVGMMATRMFAQLLDA